MKHDGVAGDDFLLEFDVVNFHEIRRVILRLVNGLQRKNAADLRHRFHLQNAGHYRVIREVSLEKGLVDGNVFAPHNAGVVHFENFVDQKEGVPVRQHACDLVDVEEGGTVGVQVGFSEFFFHLFLQDFGKRHVAGVSWTGSQDVGLNELSSEGQVAHDVQ